MKTEKGLLFWLFKGGFELYRSSYGIDFEIRHTIHYILYLSSIYYKVYTDFDDSEVASPVQPAPVLVILHPSLGSGLLSLVLG